MHCKVDMMEESWWIVAKSLGITSILCLGIYLAFRIRKYLVFINSLPGPKISYFFGNGFNLIVAHDGEYINLIMLVYTNRNEVFFLIDPVVFSSALIC